MRPGQIAGWLSIALLIAVAVFFVSQRGYGKVSTRTYEYAKAIYGACLSKSEARLSKVEVMLNEEVVPGEEANEDSQAIPARERQWLESIIQTARAGDWKPAARECRRIMNDQVSE